MPLLVDITVLYPAGHIRNESLYYKQGVPSGFGCASDWIQEGGVTTVTRPETYAIAYAHYLR